MTWLIITSLKRGRLTQDMGVWEDVCDVCVRAHACIRQHASAQGRASCPLMVGPS